MTEPNQIAATRLQGGEISRWTLRFREAAVEREFDQRWLRQSLPLMRIWSICGIVAFVAFGLAEWWIYPANLPVSLPLRYGLILPIQVASVLLTYTSWYRNLHGLSLVSCAFLSNLAALYLFAI